MKDEILPGTLTIDRALSEWWGLAETEETERTEETETGAVNTTGPWRNRFRLRQGYGATRAHTRATDRNASEKRTGTDRYGPTAAMTVYSVFS